MKLDSDYFSNIISRLGAKELLGNFSDHKLANYKSKRNFDYGSYEKNFVSALSPALSRRIITEKEIIKHVSSQFSFGQIEKFVDEICWRTYWKGWLEHRPAVWYDYLSQLENFEDVKVNNPLYNKSIEGNTGLECFDSWVRDLLEFGYLHNHSRMWFASIWIFYFNLPWQLGAEFFYQNLIDADPASNTLSWRWVAGLQTQGKKYITYKENIDRFTGGRFSFPDNFVLSDRMTDNYVYYEPNYQVLESNTTNSKNKGYMVIEDDLSFTNVIKDSPVLIQSESYNPFGQSENVKSFSDRALKSAKEYCKKNISKNVATFQWSNVEEINDWVITNKIDDVEIISPTVGKFEKLIPSTFQRLDVKSSYFFHDWDKLFWRHADKGFFKLKKNIKTIVSPFWNMPLFNSY